MSHLAVSRMTAVKLILVSTGIAAVDQMIKQRINDVPLGTTIMAYPPFFAVTHTQNNGAAFSLLSGESLLLLVATTAMLAALLLGILLYKRLSSFARWTAAILLGGGIGNWLDRFLNGEVSDYIRLLFIDFPIFNLADIFISLSAVLLIILLLIGRFEINEGETYETGH